MGTLKIKESVTIARPAAEVLEVLRDIDNQSSWWPGQYLSEVLETGDDGLVRRAKIGQDLKVAKDEFVVAYTHAPGTAGYSWSLEHATLAQRSQRGSWALEDLGDDTCAVTLEIAIDPLLPLPGFVLRKVGADSSKDAVKALKARCE
jgi:ribosome-associated toxin RatA of RatAB toxin-antitoxin module